MSFGKNSSSGSEQQNSSGTQNQTATPNNLPFLQSAWGQASNNANGSNPQVNEALSLLTNNANTASGAANTGLGTAGAYAAPGGTTNNANQYLTPFANGSMTGNSNPGFNDMVKQLGFALQPQVDGQFAAAGRYGSGANANAFNTALTNEAGQLAYGNYNDSVNRQLAAGQSLGVNNANSTNQALVALGLVPGLGTASTGAGQAAYGSAVAPTSTYANILSLLGAGGGTSNGTTTAQGTKNTQSSGTNMSLNFSDLMNPMSW